MDDDDMVNGTETTARSDMNERETQATPATHDALPELSERERTTRRENAKRVLRESGMAELLQTLNRQALQGRGWFEEYDSGVLFKWGSGFTRRHIWVDVAGENVRFRLLPHIKCAAPVPVCDGEYHTLTPAMWRHHALVLRELNRNYEHPVAESSED
ncbi:MAG: hypothetical protein ACRDHP_05835 [Ktedonobacterales bacterium]